LYPSLHAGFTLVELLISVAIVGILAAIAYPSYTSYVAKARRAEVQAELMALAQWMERIYTETGCYTPMGGTDCTGADETPDISAADAKYPYYTIDFVGASDDTFTIRATPVANSPQDGDGYLEIDQLGRRSWDENDDGAIADATERDWVRN
jgi:type IV pilus assembly protein PilE